MVDGVGATGKLEHQGSGPFAFRVVIPQSFYLAAHAALDVQRSRQHELGGFLSRDVRQEFLHVQRDSPRTLVHRHAFGLDHAVEGFDLLLVPFGVFRLAHFFHADGEDLHRPARHASVCVQAFKNDDLVPEFLEAVLMGAGDETTDVRPGVLAGIHQDDVRQMDDLPRDVQYALLRRLQLSDPVGIL